MAHKFMTATTVIGSLGDQNLAKRITISGDQVVTTVGTVVLSTNGTTVFKAYVEGGQTVQLNLPSQMAFDTVTITNVEVLMEYYKVHGKA